MSSPNNMMKTATAIGAVLLLVGCISLEPLQPYTFGLTRKIPAVCTGWQSVPLKPRTAQILEQSNPDLVTSIQDHNMRGRKMGCWQ